MLTPPRLPALPRRGSPIWLLAVALPVLAWVLEPAGVRVQLERLSWRYEIEVEGLHSVADTEWCDQLPDGADVVERRLITDPRPDHVTPAERCRYNTLAWRTHWLARAEGLRGQPPVWPHPPLRVVQPPGPGAERLGKREAFHEARLVASDGRQWTCRWDLDRWQRQPLGEHFRLPVDRFGVANCAGLR